MGVRWFRINYGFRPLIDWAKNGDWKRGSGSSGLTGPQYFATKTGAADSPHISEAGGQRPAISQFATTTAGRGMMPGFSGIYYGVQNMDRPTMQFSPNNDVADIFNSLESYAQQWLYLAAEKMKSRGDAMILKGEMEPQEMKNIEKFLSIGDATGSPERGLGQSMYKGRMKELMEGGDEKGLLSFREDKGISVKKKRATNNWMLEEDNDLHRALVNYQSGGRPRDEKGQFSRRTVRFKKMFSGMHTQWMNSFVQSVFQNANPFIKKLSSSLFNAINRLDDGGFNLNRSNALMALKDSEGGRGEIILSASGLTATEKVLQAGDIGFAPDEDTDLYQGSKPIDLKFNDLVKPSKESTQAFNRADITTEFFGAGQHHGIGKVNRQKKSVKLALQDEVSATKYITNHYNDNRIPLYNELMKTIMKATNTQTMHSARGVLKSKGLTMPEQYGGGKGYSNMELDRKGKTVLGWMDKSIKSSTMDSIKNASEDDIFWTLKWVMHHMGNMLPGGPRSPYSNVMPIHIGRVGEKVVSSLFVTFALKENGEYKLVRKGGSSVEILHNQTPLNWLYTLALDKGFEGGFDAFKEWANGMVAAEALEGGIKAGQLARFQSILSKGLETRIAMAQLNEPKFAEALDAVTTEIFSTIAEEAGKKLREEIKSTGTRFSYAARNPSKLGDLNMWWKAATEELLSQSELDRTESPQGIYGPGEDPIQSQSRRFPSFTSGSGSNRRDREAAGIEDASDPFWFLWAAPYVTSEYQEQRIATASYN